jgi:hypothetical protein
VDLIGPREPTRIAGAGPVPSRTWVETQAERGERLAGSDQPAVQVNAGVVAANVVDTATWNDRVWFAVMTPFAATFIPVTE